MGIGVWDRDLRCLRANPALSAFGHSFDDQLGLAIRHVLAAGEPITGIELGESGSHRGTVFPLRDSRGAVVAVAAVITDASAELPKRLELERQLTQEREISDVLEGSLLPDELPQLERLAIAGRLHAAGERNRVGGDFYDVFETRESLFIVLGDVAGKGPRAATLTALVRHVLRALALYERRPAILLERLREMLVERRNEPFVTIVCAVVSHPRRARRITIASSAHPLPILVRRNGSFREVGGMNPLLRYTPPGGFEETTVRLRRGDRLFFYTDGLTEARAPDEVLSAREVGGALSGREGLPLGQLLDNVIGWAVAPAGGQRDDIAALALERR